MLLLAVAGALSGEPSATVAPRLLYVARLIGALIAATLVPLLIDRRLRR